MIQPIEKKNVADEVFEKIAEYDYRGRLEKG